MNKVIPDRETLEAAYRRAYEVELLRRAAQEIADRIHHTAEAAPVPRAIVKVVRQRLAEAPTIPGDRAVAEMVRLKLDGKPGRRTEDMHGQRLDSPREARRDGDAVQHARGAP